jgi:uncharacterized membrane protein
VIGAEVVYRLAGVVVALVAVLDFQDRSNPRRHRNALFWGAYAIALFFGSNLPDAITGGLVIVVVASGTLGLGRGSPQTTPEEERRATARRWPYRLFVPALLVPLLTLVVSIGGKRLDVLIVAKDLSLVGLAFASVVALVCAVVSLRQPVAAPVRECQRLMNLMGWAAILPQMLAALGALFAAAGVGDQLAMLMGRVIPAQGYFVVVSAYTVGMALLTIVMGNAFAAFPVLTAAIGVPLLMRRFGGDPAAVAAIGMLSGFCGTLMTPMAANFNVVPAALLELPDKNGVIRAQIPTALILLLANTVLLYLLVRR